MIVEYQRSDFEPTFYPVDGERWQTTVAINLLHVSSAESMDDSATYITLMSGARHIIRENYDRFVKLWRSAKP